MKNIIKKIGISLLLTFFLSSCDIFNPLISVIDPSASGGDSGNSSQTSLPSDEGYEKVNVNMTLDTVPQLGVFSNYVDGYCPTVGSPNMVVIPLGFTDTDDWTEDEIAIVREAYTSETLDDEGAFYSLSEYYKVSSYGALTIDVTVSSPLTLGISARRFEALGTYSAFIYLLNDAMEFLVSEGYSLADFDSDGDGVIDGIHFIYKTTQTSYGDGGSEFWWNYTSYRPISELDVPSGQLAAPCIYFFSEYRLIINGYYGTNVPDTHTIIHETGHMLGLDDYYDYDSSEAPAGGADMMDLNMGDHNAYSKMLLGWTDPYVVNGTSDNFQITLKPFAESGEFIILRNTAEAYNETPFDEFLVLSYYTPTSLNELDSNGYPEWTDSPSYGTGSLYSISGLQVYHVDARLIVQDSSSQYRYWDPHSDTISSVLTNRTSNTGSTSAYVTRTNRLSTSNGPYRLIEAITSDGIDHFGSQRQLISGIYSAMGKNNYLFGIGDNYSSASFHPDNFEACFYNRSMFNDYTTLNYSFEVTAMNDEGLTVAFSKIAQFCGDFDLLDNKKCPQTETFFQLTNDLSK